MPILIKTVTYLSLNNVLNINFINVFCLSIILVILNLKNKVYKP